MEQLAFNVHPINRIDHHLWPFSWRHRTECSKYFITGTNPSRPSLRPTVGYFMEQLLVAFLAFVLTTLIPAHVSVLSADTTVNQLNIMLWLKKTGFAPMEFALLKHLRVSWIALSHMKKFLTVRIFLWEAFQQHTCNEWDCLSTEFYVYISRSFHHSIQRVRETLRSIFSKALMRMVDFICGDFNLFANRQFYRDVGGSMLGGIVVEVLEDAI